MRSRIGVLASYFILSTAAAASYSSYFYTTDDVPAADIACEEEVSQTVSENSCYVKCAKQRCYRCRWSNGVCSVTGRSNVTFSGKHISKYNKVSAVFQFTFTVKFNCKVFQKKYVVVNEKKNIADSSVHCKSIGGTLALPESVEEDQQMLQEIGKDRRLLFRLQHSFFA